MFTLNLDWIAKELQELDKTMEINFFLEILTDGMVLIKEHQKKERK